MARSIFLTGCNRGLGLEMVKQLVSGPKKPQHLFATCRNVDKATELKNLANNHPEIHIKELDVTDESSYKDLVKWVEGTVGAEGLNLLINNAGFMKKDSLKSVTSQSMLDHFKTQTVAPLILTQNFHLLLKKAAATLGGADGTFSSSKACVVNITAHMASLKDNTTSFLYAYRISKTGLNMATKNLSIDLQKDGILVSMMHPGWVKTDLGGSGAPVELQAGVKKILGTISSLKKEHVGAFLNSDGSSLPW